jgi:LysR family glycine cleavage system transcriptional activator
MPSLTALRTFEAAGRYQNFTLAAQELLVTHAAVSRQIRRLEYELAVRLFHRTGNRVELTAAGSDLLHVLTPAFDSIAVATNRASAGRRPNRLVLCVDPGLAARWLNERLADFRRLDPGIDVEIFPSLNLIPFEREQVDAAIHYAYVAPAAPLRSVHLIAVEAFPVCSPRLLADGRGLRTPGDLADHRLLHEQDTTWWRRWLELVGEDDVDWSKGAVYHDSGLVLDAAAAGQGVAVGDNVLAFEALEDGRLIRPFVQTCPSGSYYFVKPAPDLQHPALPTFETWLVQECADQATRSAKWIM